MYLQPSEEQVTDIVKSLQIESSPSDFPNDPGEKLLIYYKKTGDKFVTQNIFKFNYFINNTHLTITGFIPLIKANASTLELYSLAAIDVLEKRAKINKVQGVYIQTTDEHMVESLYVRNYDKFRIYSSVLNSQTGPYTKLGYTARKSFV